MTWLEKLKQKNRSVEVFSPTDSPTRHPYPGTWVVMGPLGEWAFSFVSAEEAALHYLAIDDQEARAAIHAFPPTMKKAV